MVGIARATTPADRVFDVCNTLLLLVLAFITLYPLYYVGSVSLSHGHAVIRGEVHWWPVGLNLESYRAVLEAPYVLGSFRNTVWYTFVGTAVNVSMSALCAYPLAMKFFYGRRFLTGFVVATMFFKSGLIPLYLMVRSLGMLDTIWALVLPTAVVTYYMIIMRTFFQNIPRSSTTRPTWTAPTTSRSSCASCCRSPRRPGDHDAVLRPSSTGTASSRR